MKIRHVFMLSGDFLAKLIYPWIIFTSSDPFVWRNVLIFLNADIFKCFQSFLQAYNPISLRVSLTVDFDVYIFQVNIGILPHIAKFTFQPGDLSAQLRYLHHKVWLGVLCHWLSPQNCVAGRGRVMPVTAVGKSGASFVFAEEQLTLPWMSLLTCRAVTAHSPTGFCGVIELASSGFYS